MDNGIGQVQISIIICYPRLPHNTPSQYLCIITPAGYIYYSKGCYTKASGSNVLRKTLLFLSLIILVATGSVSAATPEDVSGWEQIAPGIEYQKFTLPDPNNVFVVRMDRENHNLTLESTIAQGKLSSGRETVSGMYSRYDQALNFWGASPISPTWGTTITSTWGLRNQVVVAINGSYFDWNTGVPEGGMIQSGWYAKRYTDYAGGSGFFWKLDRTATIGECVIHQPEKQIVAFPETGRTQDITGINKTRGTDQLILFTPQFDSHTGTNSSGVEVLVEMTRPTMILPPPAYATGIVQEIRNAAGNSLIRFDSIVLSASGTAAQALLQNAHVGKEVHISQELTSFYYDCETPYKLNWTKAYAAIEGAFFFLKNGVIRDFTDPGATARNPRTAILFNENYIFYLVVDGRDTQHSIGMSIHELAVFARDTLGATWGTAQDGGGSSTMVINGQVVNNTLCNNYPCYGYTFYLPSVMRNSRQAQSVEAAEPDVVRTSAGVERLVANGMLMVIVQPEQYSYAFKPNDLVTTKGATDVRLGPGTNYASISTIPKGTHGTVRHQMNDLDGVYAKNTYWWYVNFGSVTGWVPEGTISK
jgi:hypothetical protein